MINLSTHAEGATKYEQSKPESHEIQERDPSLPKESVEFSFGKTQPSTSTFSENNFFKLQLQDRGHNLGSLKNLFHHSGVQNNVGSTLNISH